MDFPMRKSFKRQASSGGSKNNSSQELPILFDTSANIEDNTDKEIVSGKRRGNNNAGTSSNFDQRGQVHEDPRLKVRSRFSNKQRGASEIALNRDLEMGEVRELESSSPLNNVENEVVHRTAKMKSRLMDPPERRSGRVGNSGPMIREAMEEEEDDQGNDLPDKYRAAHTTSKWTLIQCLLLFLCIVALLVTYFTPSWKKWPWGKLEPWRWVVLILFILCGCMISNWGISLIVFFMRRNYFLRKRVMYFACGVRDQFQYCGWFGLILLTWHFLIDEKDQIEKKSDILRSVTRVVGCFWLSTLLWLGNKLLVKVVASSFHVRSYLDRIQDSLSKQYVIEVLSRQPRTEAEQEERTPSETFTRAKAAVPPHLRAGFLPPAKSGRVIGSGEITIDHLEKLNHKNISAWSMKRLMNMVRHGALTTLDNQSLEDEAVIQIRSEFEAKVAASRIFMNVAQTDSEYIELKDLKRFMRADEALKTMAIFEGAYETQKISKSYWTYWVVNAVKERRALALTLDDTKTAVSQLHQMVNVIVGIIIGFIWLLILGVTTIKFFVIVTSPILLLVFMFGNTCKTVFEAIIFLFIVHPFDVGDRCEIDGVEMVVEEMNLMTTVFMRYDNLRIEISNSTLSTKVISNYYRSPDMEDVIEFGMDISTAMDKIDTIEQVITTYIEEKPEHWYSPPIITVKDTGELNKLKMAILLQHKMNHQNMREKETRRAQCIKDLSKKLWELGIRPHAS